MGCQTDQGGGGKSSLFGRPGRTHEGRLAWTDVLVLARVARLLLLVLLLLLLAMLLVLLIVVASPRAEDLDRSRIEFGARVPTKGRCLLARVGRHILDMRTHCLDDLEDPSENA